MEMKNDSGAGHPLSDVHTNGSEKQEATLASHQIDESIKVPEQNNSLGSNLSTAPSSQVLKQVASEVTLTPMNIQEKAAAFPVMNGDHSEPSTIYPQGTKPVSPNSSVSNGKAISSNPFVKVSFASCHPVTSDGDKLKENQAPEQVNPVAGVPDFNAENGTSMNSGTKRGRGRGRGRGEGNNPENPKKKCVSSVPYDAYCNKKWMNGQAQGPTFEPREPVPPREAPMDASPGVGSSKDKESQPSQHHGFNPVPPALTTLLKEGLPSTSAKKPPMNVIRQNLEMMSSMLKNDGDSISSEMRSKLESEKNGLLKKVSSVPNPSS